LTSSVHFLDAYFLIYFCQADEKMTIIGRVLRKSSNFLEYAGKSGTMKYFNIIVGNVDTISHLRCYQKHKFTMVREGLTYKYV